MAVAVASTLAGSGNGNALPRVENGRTGLTVVIPHEWRMTDDAPNGSGAVILSTYPLEHVGELGETPPESETWILLYDYGPLSSEPSWSHQIRPLPSLLPPEKGYEIFGTARLLDFRSGGHHFTAYLKGNPRPAATLGILRSISITRVG